MTAERHTMFERNTSAPWAFVAHKDGKLGGVTIADRPKGELKKFLGEFAADGFTITPVNSRDEYDALTSPMMMWQP